jgi:asparagine synthetase B (glutamine-hydrolysing)
VLEGYLRWGEGVLARIKGIFALIIWDTRRDLLLAVRDHLGIYPLFYTDNGRGLLFSTSIDALTAHPLVSRDLNRGALADYLWHRWPDIGETFYSQIKRVPPGCVKRVDNTGFRVYRYWDPAPPAREMEWLREEELEAFDVLFQRVVGRFVDIGPVGIFLSGGLDSVSVAALAAHTCQERGLPLPRAFSLVFPNPDCNEVEVQQGVARGLGLSQVMVPFATAAGPQGVFKAALDLSREWSAPLMGLWMPAYQYLGTQARRQGCRVILTGDGGDEWLGVSPILAADLMKAMDLEGLRRLWVTQRRSFEMSNCGLFVNLFWRYGARLLLRSLLQRTFPQVMLALRRRRLRLARPSWVAPGEDLAREMEPRMERHLAGGVVADFYHHEIQPLLESSVVSMEMEESFEGARRLGLRVCKPYWDQDLVELLCRVPPRLLNQGGTSKGLVRHVISRRFPHLGFEKQKKVSALSFGRSIIMQEGAPAWRNLGGPTALARLGIVDLPALSEVMAKLFKDQNSREFYSIYDVLTLESWVRPRL